MKETASKRQEIIKSRAPLVTISSVSDLECPLKFKTLRIDKNWPANREANNAASYGDCVHEVLRGIYLRRHDGKPDLQFVDALVRGAVFGKAWSPGHDLGAEVVRVKKAVIAFVESDDYDDVHNTIELECRYDYPVFYRGELLYLLSAKFDRVLLRKDIHYDCLVVRDYKTSGRKKVSLKEAAIILTVATEKYPEFPVHIVQYDWLNPEERIERTTITREDVRGQLEMIHDDAVRVLTAAEFAPSPGDCCIYCPLRQVCPAVGGGE